MMPSYFFAHGAPSIVLEHNDYTQFLKNFRTTQPKPRAIVMFSAHWEHDIQQVSTVSEYATMYDFSGFPEELYQMTYPAKGDPAVSDRVCTLLDQHQISYRMDDRRGLDHGAWAVLKWIHPEADVPVIAMSVNRELTNEQQYQIGKALAALKGQDVMIIGSGGTSHNLRAVNWRANGVDAWADAFEHWIQERLQSWDTEALFRYRERAPHAAHAVPTNEHFIPLLLAMGAGDEQRQATLLHRSFQYGNLSLTCWQFA